MSFFYSYRCSNFLLLDIKNKAPIKCYFSAICDGRISQFNQSYRVFQYKLNYSNGYNDIRF